MLKDQFEGCILGLAIGDALGYPCEFRTRNAILETFGPSGVRDFLSIQDPRWPARPIILGEAHPPGTYTDDTQMSLAVARAIVAKGHAELDELMEEMGREFVVWAQSPDNNRAPGATCMQGARQLERGSPWREAGVADSKGCGSAMRVAPIGLAYHEDRTRLLEVARASSLLTHGHDAAVEGAAAAALLIALALEGADPESMYREVMQECATASEDFRTCMSKLPQLIDHPPEVVLSKDGLGESWVAEEAVASALYCFWRSPTDFEETVITAANTDGDSDSIACIAGGISGAFNGISALPERWTSTVEDAALLLQIARGLLSFSGG